MTALPLARLLNHAADAVQAVLAGQSLNDALARCPLPARPGAQALSFHVMRCLGGAQAARKRLVPKTPPAPVDALLLTALALLWNEHSADASYAPHTVVDQAVEAAKQRAPASSSFINAVLRRFLRERETLIAALTQSDEVAHFQHPQWWTRRLQADWPDRWQALLHKNNQRAPMTLRVNARRNSVSGYIQRLADAGIEGHAAGPHAVALASPCPVQQLPGFAQGDVSVQDAAAQLAAPLLIGTGLQSGARVLDACAAPGGKTAHLLELADLHVTALDSDAHRLQRVHDNLSRLELKAHVIAGDARHPELWWDGQPFDAVLLDAPCSASGIVRRHPDARWLRRAGDIPALAQTQAQMLDALWAVLKPGGHLLYCTCSVFKCEGQEAIDAFLQRQPNAEVLQPPASPGHLLGVPDNPLKGGATEGSEALPDGFFYALLAKPLR